MKATRLFTAAATVLATVATAFAAEPPPGASSCSGCHAVRAGVETVVPPLKGRKAADIVDAMKEFRAGQRGPTIMDRIAKGYTDAEVQAIAAWYEQQR
jgi:cytochrome subunit of sulfide dehydrogenase